MNNDVFVVLNEYQYWVSCAIVKKNGIDNPVFIIMGRWSPIRCEHSVYQVAFTDMRNGKLQKLLKLLVNNCPKIRANSIYIPSTLDPYVSKIARALRPQHISVFDEGGGAVYSFMPPKRWFEPLVLLGWVGRVWGEGRNIDYVFSPNPELFSDKLTKPIVDISKEMREVADELYGPMLDEISRNKIKDVIVLTQPYPADYLSGHGNGNEVLFNFAAEKWEEVNIKAHPRELPANRDSGKFTALPKSIQNIPIQAIALKFEITAIVSNCSSALLNIAKISGRDIVSYSLIKRVEETRLTKPFLAAASKVENLFFG
ncbi:polysialyltransferase family glycosyltransferase [Chromobacterium violaceum]|uniref:polysialyltransferase family glycosyltransferase n=1 Tax=Chromobacterium violaceum TaxID=536 RepID=UPI000AE859C7|nr:polysialyltransferase family glycosyltransferase [Chromobacterium violaceum]